MHDNQDTMLASNSGAGGGSRSKRNILKTHKRLIVIAGIAITVVLVLWGVYSLGYDKGHDKGYGKATAEATAKARTSDPLRALTEANRNYWSIVGSVEAVDGNTITVKNNKGKTEKATFTDNLEVTQKSNKNGANKSNLKVGQNVIVIGQKNDDKLSASRITIKE